MTPTVGGGVTKANDAQDFSTTPLLGSAGADTASLSISRPHSALLRIPSSTPTNTNSISSTSSNIANNSSVSSRKVLEDPPQESYSPWDMPPIIQPISSTPDSRTDSGGGLKGFSNLNSTWPHFRSKPHPTISVPMTPTSLPRPGFDMAAPSTPPRNSSYSNPEDSDNAMCTPTFGSSHSNYSRRNSAVSGMALDTPPPLSLMDLESSLSLSGSSFSSGAHGPLSRSLESGFSSGNHGYPFPLFGTRHDTASTLSRRSSRANSVSMESRHVRKPSEDTNMSDGGNNSGSERTRRHSPAVVPFERSVRRSALLPKPKGLLKVFNQLEEEIHHNRHEYDHEREITQVRKGTTGEEPSVTLMDTGVAASTRQAPFSLHPLGNIRRPSASRLNPEQELNDFQRQQEEYDKLFQMHQLEHLTRLQQHEQQQQQPQPHAHPLQATLLMQDSQEFEGPTNAPYLAHSSTLMASMPSSPLQTPMVTRSKRKSSMCEERFDPYHSSHLKRRAVSPSIGPMVSHRRSPSSSPARHLAGHSRSKITALPSPSATGSSFRHGHGLLGGGSIGAAAGVHGGTLENNGASSDDSMGTRSSSSLAGSSISDSNDNSQSNINGVTNGTSVSSTLNLQHTSRSFSELSLGRPKSHAHS